MSPKAPPRKLSRNPPLRWASLASIFVAGSLLAAPLTTDEGYTVPRDNPTFTFPRDHGSHPDFGLEWWYLVTHLEDEAGARYGLQATFFRTARVPPEDRQEESPSFDDAQLYLAHMALAEIETGRYRHEERLNRGGWNAGASTETLDLYNGNWRLELIEPTPESETLHLTASIRGAISFDMTYTNTKPLVRFGEGGLSLKGEAPDARSYYLTFTRLAAEGTLTIEGKSFRVTGSGWLDHEISSGQLADNQVGWNWTGTQLDDGREIMGFILRRDDGSVDPYSVLYVVEADGTFTTHTVAEFEWRNLRTWTSPETGGEYPIEVEIAVPGAPGGPLFLHLVPLLEEAELGGTLGGIDYWEGPMEVRDQDGGKIGRAYLELTGYSGSIGDRL